MRDESGLFMKVYSGIATASLCSTLFVQCVAALLEAKVFV